MVPVLCIRPISIYIHLPEPLHGWQSIVYCLWHASYYGTITPGIYHLGHLLSCCWDLPPVHCRSVSFFQDRHALHCHDQFPKLRPSSAKKWGGEAWGCYNSFTIGSLHFTLSGRGCFIKYAVTCGEDSFPFPILPLDSSTESGPLSNLNLLHYIWNYFALLSCRMCTIVALPADTPHILYLKRHRAESEGRTSSSLCSTYILSTI